MTHPTLPARVAIEAEATVHNRYKTGRRPSVLCIEDDYETAALISEELDGRGFEVLVASDGRIGWSLLLNYGPNIVLCDVGLPIISGFQFIESLAELPQRFSRTPFIFLTARDHRNDELRARRLGADDYIVKPIDFDVLEAVLKTRLRKTGVVHSSPTEYGLTEREIEALKWAARGKTSEEIAIIMAITERTVNFHIDNARQRLGVSTRIQAAVKAAVAGFFEP